MLVLPALFQQRFETTFARASVGRSEAANIVSKQPSSAGSITLFETRDVSKALSIKTSDEQRRSFCHKKERHSESANNKNLLCESHQAMFSLVRKEGA